MALAILTWQDTDEDYAHFDIDIGIANRYYRYQIGDQSMRRENGLKRLAAPQATSSLMGPLPVESLGRESLKIPTDQLDRTHRYVQLFSFRTAQLEGPALSEIIQVPVSSLSPERMSPEHIPALSLGLEEEMSYTIEPSAVAHPPVDVVAFAYKEAPPVDTAMAIAMAPGWLGKVGNLAKKATAVVTNPQAQNALKQAGNFLANPNKQQMLMNAGTSLLSGLGGQQAQPPLNTEAIEQLLNYLVQKNESIEQLLSTMVQGNGMGTGLPQSAASLMPPPRLANRVAPMQGRPATQLRSGQPALVTRAPVNRTPVNRAPVNRNVRPQVSRARSLSLSLSASVPSAFALDRGYTQQMAGPLAALPALVGAGGTGGMTALMPLLQQVLTPETAQMLLQTISPAKLIGAVTESITQIAKVNLESKKVDLGHLEKIMVEDETAEKNWLFAQSLATQSLAARPFVTALAGSPEAIDYRRIGSVRLAFAEVTPLMLHGRSRILYHRDRDITFPLTLETPRAIHNARLQLLVKDPETLEILLEETYRVEDADSGALEVSPQLSREQLAGLEANEDYLVTVALVWKGRSRRTQRRTKLGTSMTQLITLMGDYCFDRIEGTAETISLKDVDRYRSYWHKVWQGDLSSKRRGLKLDCKYYYTLERDRTTLARMETLTRIQQTSTSRQQGQLKAGMMLNPDRLNALLDQVSDYPALEEEELAALLNTDNLSLFNALARTEVRFKGRRGSTVALWVYPEFKIQRILLKQAAEIDHNGHVTELTEHPVHFPMPAKAHFIGVSDDD
ncbi:MAG: hypothetical protein AAFV90_23195 [Cyanobacteria bacterium J06634_5]